MGVPVEFHPVAIDDFHRHAAWLASRSPGAAERFTRAVEAAGRRLSAHPRIGHPIAVATTAVRELRTWPVPGFTDVLLVYVVDRQAVHVIRVLHAARDLPGLLEK